jgi:hypothetical protein
MSPDRLRLPPANIIPLSDIQFGLDLHSFGNETKAFKSEARWRCENSRRHTYPKDASTFHLIRSNEGVADKGVSRSRGLVSIRT